MKKNIYTVINAKHNADYFTVAVTFDLDEAIAKMHKSFNHLTRIEQEKSDTYVEVREIDVLDGETADAAYDRLLDEDEWPGDYDIAAKA